MGIYWPTLHEAKQKNMQWALIRIPLFRNLKNRSSKKKALTRQNFEFKVGGESYFGNVADTGFKDLFAVAQIRQAQIYHPIKTLGEKSGFVILLAVCISLLITFLFSTRLIARIKELREAIDGIGSGQWNVTLNSQANDEIGATAARIEWMADQLRAQISKTGESVYEETEQAFLPATNLESLALESEERFPTNRNTTCFLDSHALGPYLTLVIGESTTLGNSAALGITIAKACFSSINSSLSEKPVEPDIFLNTLNRTVHSMCGGMITITTCVASLNLETGECRIASAGHRGPLHLKPSENGFEVEELSAIGELVGAKTDATYEAIQYQLGINDILLFHTTGLTEIVNGEGKTWGEKRLIETLVAHAAEGVKRLRTEIENGLSQHVGKEMESLDVALRLLRWKQVFSTAYPEATQSKTKKLSIWIESEEKRRVTEGVPEEISKVEEKVPVERQKRIVANPESVVPSTKRPLHSPKPDRDEETALREAFLFEDKDWPNAA